MSPRANCYVMGLLAGVVVTNLAVAQPEKSAKQLIDETPLKTRVIDNNWMYENGRLTSFIGPDTVTGAVACVTKDALELWTEKGKPAVVFPAHDYLAAGSRHLAARNGGNSYRLQDVKVGDIVEIGVFKEGKATYCVDIRIRKRPGGKVPNDNREGGELSYSWYEWQNHLHDFLDRDIPLPDRWRSVAVLKNGKIVDYEGPAADDIIREKHAHEKGLPDYHPDADKFDLLYRGEKAKLKAPTVAPKVPDTIPKSK